MKKRAEVYETVEVSCKDNFAINFLYGNLIGRVFLSLFVRPVVSKFAGLILNSPATKIFIRGFIKQNNIKMEEYADAKYKSFNDFFKRQIKKGLRPFPADEHDLAAPCDGKLTAYTITANSAFQIKNSVYTVDGLLQDKKLAAEFMNGICVIFRLMPNDFHRYSYFDDGETLLHKKIKGVLHTVRPISQLHYHVFSRNAREYAVIQTKNFGKAIQMEIGALFVGRITNHKTERPFKRGDEKGMFEFGGSTVVVLFRENAITLDEAIFENTRQNKETVVKMGSKIGEKAKREKGKP